MTMSRLQINYFQRRPREGFSFSLESIFEDVRNRLSDQIIARVYLCRCYNDGYYTKFINILEAAFRHKKGINHITGEVHFLNLLMKTKNVLLTIHDCGMMGRKKGLSKKIVKWLYLVAPIRKAAVVTAVSETTKREIIHYTGCDPEKIKVVPVAVDPLYKPSPKLFNSLKPVVLHIGTGPNKNLPRLIEALAGISCHLKIIGKLSDEHFNALNEHRIDYSNAYNISNEELLENYRGCDIMAFVSTFEGFGMPIVEANAVERVVVTSSTSSMPEVASNAACLVDPYDVQSIRNGILRVISDEAYRDGLIENGRINKRRFDADLIANQYFDLYKIIAGGQAL